MGVAEHDFFRQWAMLEQYLAEAAQDQPKEAAAAP
jgi:hypothetical protein